MKRIAFLVTVCFARIAAAQEPISYPMLMATQPLAAQVGTTAEHVIDSRYSLEGAYQVLVDGEGVRGEVGSAVSEKPPITKLRLRFSVAANAMPGPRSFRIATPQGISTVGQLVVTRDPVTVENEKNNTPAAAQQAELPATVCGTISKAEEVDYYKFHARAGQALTFHVRAARCEDKIHDLQIHIDPILTLRNAQGTVLAANDNYFYADPLLNYRFKDTGEYTLEIRDVRYQGNIFWRYLIEINDRPFVTNVFPLAVRPEEPTRVEMIGYNLPTDRFATLTLRGNAPAGPQWTTLPIKGPQASPAPVVVSRLPLLLESDNHQEPSTAQAITAPVGVNGRISNPGEIDYYGFDAKKGDRFSFTIVARQHASALDPSLAILNDKGVRLLENDDITVFGRLVMPDAQIENWTAPADGRYTIEVRDMLSRGGPEYVYLLEATRSDPYLALATDCDKSILGPGGYATVYVRASRRNGLTGEIQLAIEGLPPGVTAQPGRILDGSDDGIIILKADANAKPVVSVARIVGTLEAKDGEKTVKHTATSNPWQETYLPGGGRGLYLVDSFVVSVAAPLDLRAVKIQPAEITLQPGASQKIEITIERAEGFKKNVTLDMLYRHLGGISGNCLPPGVTIDEKASKTLLSADQTTGHIVLTAAKDAKPVTKQQTSVQAHVSINFVMKFSYSSEPLFITVEEKAAK